MILSYLINVKRLISISEIQILQIKRIYHYIASNINKLLGKDKDLGKIRFQPLIYSNLRYGNEYVIRRYADIKKNEDLFAIIEHGLYFGNNTCKIPNENEWKLGCILTYGEYRKKLIDRFFPNYYCETIGPPILYAENINRYIKLIVSELQVEGRSLLFYPAHGLKGVMTNYAFAPLIDQLLTLAVNNHCNNIIINEYYLSPCNGLYSAIKNRANGIKVYRYSCGSANDQEFLYRQRALISISAITVSNSLGTHIGNCVGLHKPHVYIKQDIIYEGNNVDREFGREVRSLNWNDQFEKEQKLFAKFFSFPKGQASLTDEQYNMCDYYWGFTKKKTPEEIREIFVECRKHAIKFTNAKKSAHVSPRGGGWDKSVVIKYPQSLFLTMAKRAG